MPRRPRPERRFGQMFVVAVLCDDRTIEDAIQISRKSAQLVKACGFTGADQAQSAVQAGSRQTVSMKKASYDVIGDDGMPRVGASVGGTTWLSARP